jgi:hypothetical protein
VDLAAQQVEILAGVVGVATWMLFSAQSDSQRSTYGVGVLGPLAFVAVREQHHQAAHELPLALAGRDELVDDRLRAVDEVAELRLPHHQRPRVGQRVAVLEAEHRQLAQHAVVDRDVALVFAQVREGDEALCRVVVVEDGVAVENVPRSTSWPIRRTQWPSSSEEPIASISALPQSSPLPVSTVAMRWRGGA